jgi:hypothetical protein
MVDPPSGWVEAGRRRGVLRETDDFTDSFGRLQVAVREACSHHDEWPARVAAGIHAALGFAAADAAAARVLTADADAGGPSGTRQVIRHFAELLGEEAPHDRRLLASSDEALVSGIVKMISGHVRSDRLDRLDELAPEVVYLTLLPYLGFSAAKRWASLPVYAVQ